MLHRQSARLLFRVKFSERHSSKCRFILNPSLSFYWFGQIICWSQWEGRGQHSTDQLMSSESKYPGGQCGEWPDVWYERPGPDCDLVWHCDTIHSHITLTPGIGQQWEGGPMMLLCTVTPMFPAQPAELSIWSPSAEETLARASRGALYMLHVAQ